MKPRYRWLGSRWVCVPLPYRLSSSYAYWMAVQRELERTCSCLMCRASRGEVVIKD